MRVTGGEGLRAMNVDYLTPSRRFSTNASERDGAHYQRGSQLFARKDTYSINKIFFLC